MDDRREYWREDGHRLASVEMTLRDYFAAKAMQALIAASGDISSRRYIEKLGDPPKHFAIGAYSMADAMLQERAK